MADESEQDVPDGGLAGVGADLQRDRNQQPLWLGSGQERGEMLDVAQMKHRAGQRRQQQQREDPACHRHAAHG